MKKHLLQMASAASLAACLALPGLAQADVCRKIDYKFAAKVYDQVVLHTANSYIYARDAACILKHVKFASEQEKIGVYLAGKLSDPENVNYLLKAVKMQHVRDKISQAALAAQPPPPPPPPPPPQVHHHPGHYPPPPPPPPRIQIVHNVSSKIDYTFAGKIMEQLQLYTAAPYFYPREPPAIMKKIAFANYQEEIGIYLSGHLADPENINLMLNEVKFQNTREAITKAALQNNAGRPQPLRPPPPPPPYMPPPPPPPPQPRVQVVHNVHQKIDYTFPGKIMEQVRLYIGNSYIYASDAAAILKKIDFPNYQKEVGAYLCPKIADRENLDVFIKAPDFPDVQNALTKACLGN